MFIREEMPDGATPNEAQVDYTEDLGQFENIVTLDVDEIELLEGVVRYDSAPRYLQNLKFNSAMNPARRALRP